MPLSKTTKNLCWIVWWVCSLTAEVQARPDQARGDCLISTDFYIVHFTAFQPPKKMPTDLRERRQALQRYCRELPNTGTTFLGIDFIDRDVRQLPIALKVVEESGDTGDSERVLKALPAKRYPHGVAEMRVDFDRPGHYALVVEFGDHPELADDRLRIPLTVGIERWHVPWLAIAAAISIGLFFSMIAFFVLHFRRGETVTS